MRKRLVFGVAVGGVLSSLLVVGVVPGFGQAQAPRPTGQAQVPPPGGRGQAQAPGPNEKQICRYQAGCRTIRLPSILTTPPANWKMPRTPAGKPDFTGVYAGPGFTQQVGPDDTDTSFIRGYDSSLMPPFAAGGEKIFYRPPTGDDKIDDPIGLCLPFGFTGQILSPYAEQVVQAPNYLVIRHEFMNNFSRIIPLDGRPHPKDPELTWGGHSVGHWEGDTLVIDTVGLKEWWLDVPYPKGSLWHSDAMHVIERMKWIAPKVASYDVTLDDPKVWTKPWTEHFYMVLHPTWELMEYVCNENDRCAGGKCVASDAQKP